MWKRLAYDPTHRLSPNGVIPVLSATEALEAMRANQTAARSLELDLRVKLVGWNFQMEGAPAGMKEGLAKHIQAK